MSHTVDTTSVRTKAKTRRVTTEDFSARWLPNLPTIRRGERQSCLDVTRAPACSSGERAVLVGGLADRLALRAPREEVFGHRDAHLRRDVHVHVLVEALSPAGDQVLEAHELVHERVDRLLVAHDVHRIAERAAQDDRLRELVLAHESLLGELPGAAAAELVGRGAPDRVADVAGDVAEEDGFIGSADLGAAVIPGLGEAIEGLVGEVIQLFRKGAGTLHPESDDRERAESQ